LVFNVANIVDLEGWADTVHRVCPFVFKLIADNTVSRIDGCAYHESIGFQSHTLAELCTISVNNCHQQFRARKCIPTSDLQAPSVCYSTFSQRIL
jgi:hypothetical protein